MQHSPIQELLPFEIKLCHNAVEATENICRVNGEVVVDRYSNLIVEEISFVLQEPRQSGKVNEAYNCGFRQVALEEYQASLVFYSQGSFVTFTTSAKIFGATELCFLLPKCCKTFDSSSIFKN